jgi:hypothetical protein
MLISGCTVLRRVTRQNIFVMIPHSTSKPIYELSIGWNLLGKGIIVLTPHYPIGLRQSNLLMVVSVVTAIDNILMGHIGLYGFREFGKTA